MRANHGASPVPRLGGDEPPEALYAALDEAGCLVVADALPAARCGRIENELAQAMAAARVVEKDDPKQFYPGHTRRVTGLVSRSETVREVIAHGLSRQLAQRHLGANCERIQLHVTAAVSIGPGARAQVLHREEDLFPFFPVPRPNLILASMWAINDFTADNGATLLVPGSHRWDAEREAVPSEVVSAEIAGGLGALLAGRHAARRRRQHVEQLALRRHSHLLARLAAARGEPILGHPVGGPGNADAGAASAHRPCNARRPWLLRGRREGSGRSGLRRYRERALFLQVM